jgi:MFS family permease
VLGGDFLSALGSGLTIPFFLVYLHRVRGMDFEIAGLALSTIALAGFVGNPIGGALSDRIGPRNSLVLGLVCTAAGACAVAFVAEPWHALGAAALEGVGAAIVWPSQDALLASVVEPRQRSSAFAVRHATLNAGLGVGGLAAAFIVDVSSLTSFQTIYLIDAATYLAFVPVLLTLRAVGGPREREPSEKIGYRGIVRDRTFVSMWLITALLVCVGYAQLHAAFPAYATGAGALSPPGLGVAFAANTLAVVVAQLLVLRLAQGRRRTRAIMLLCAFWAATWAMVLAAGELTGEVAATFAFSSAMVVFAIGETLLSPTLPAIANDLAPDSMRGRYNGAYTLAWTTGFATGPLVAGVAFGAGVGQEFLVVLIAGCGTAAMGARALERRLPASANVIGEEIPVEEVGPVPLIVEPAVMD